MNKHKLAYLFLFIFVCFLLFVFNAYFVPFGQTSYKKDFTNKFTREFNIYKLGPSDRLKDDNIMISEPLYFYVRSPLNFDRATVNFVYSFNKELASDKNYDIKLGILRDRDNWRFDLKSVFNSIIENLDKNNYVYEDGLLFYQREANFSSLHDYLEHNNFNDLVLYNYNLSHDYYIENYLTGNTSLKFQGLRSSHSFLVYIDNEDLDIDFSFSLLEETDSGINIAVYKEADKIFQDSISASDIKENKPFFYNLNLKDLDNSVYRVEILSNDNYIIDTMEASVGKLVFLNKVNISTQAKEHSFYAGKGQLRLKALDAACLGDIYINKEKYQVEEMFVQHLFDLDQDLNLIEFDSCGFLLEGNLLFSASADSWFNPLIDRLNTYNDFEANDYLIADYQKADKKGDSYLSSLDFDLSSINRHKGEYQFLISAPFLSDKEDDVFIEIESIEIIFSKESILDKLKRLINSFFKYDN